jgi:hypothetical protein
MSRRSLLSIVSSPQSAPANLRHPLQQLNERDKKISRFFYQKNYLNQEKDVS